MRKETTLISTQLFTSRCEEDLLWLPLHLERHETLSSTKFPTFKIAVQQQRSGSKTPGSEISVSCVWHFWCKQRQPVWYRFGAVIKAMRYLATLICSFYLFTFLREGQREILLHFCLQSNPRSSPFQTPTLRQTEIERRKSSAKAEEKAQSATGYAIFSSSFLYQKKRNGINTSYQCIQLLFLQPRILSHCLAPRQSSADWLLRVSKPWNHQCVVLLQSVDWLLRVSLLYSALAGQQSRFITLHPPDHAPRFQTAAQQTVWGHGAIDNTQQLPKPQQI